MTIAVRLARIGFALLGAVALVWIPARNLDVDSFSIANYFSYFTILSNVLSVIVLLVGGLLDPQDPRWQNLRGAVTVYMVITCVVYAVLLADVDVTLNDKWINDTMHRLIPIVVLADWLISPPRTRIDDKQCLTWLAFPAVYAVYSLIRGPIVDWYPYPFIDPRQQGYLELAFSAVVLTVAMVLLALAVGAVGRLAARWRYR
ncbi:Pr6Pr family membrane protein [Antrihabitans stalactiti]|uniref:FAR-17a/AIG1-like protein n=1 Tax=Antrihabitans stalactiti TaxID=2584121 RepID=A0A848K757_9NOCA|nr:hypothetical protein [Antrihabitans stalactiti]